MTPEELKSRNLETEFTFATARSSGPGGQNVNKVNTKVELRFNISLSRILLPEEKVILLQKLRNKINTEGELILTSQSERTQLANKSAVTEKFFKIISAALTIQKKRRATGPTPGSKLKRLNEKKIRSMLKNLRKVKED
jgi:ribosome-associated protein